MRGGVSFVGALMIFGVFSGVIQAKSLDKGVGPYGEFWKPIPTQRYWAPDYFYSPPEDPRGVYNADECTLCHKALNPGLVKAWAESSHANLDKLQDYQKEKLAEIEKTKIAARCMVGQPLSRQRALHGRAPQEVIPPYFSVKEAVFPFNKFPGVDPILGPEMRSTGEVMGAGRSFGEAMLKSQLGAGSRLPTKGTVVITVKNGDKARALLVARDLVELGFAVVATKGTAAAIAAAGIPVKVVNKVKDGRPHIADMVKAGEIQLVFTTVDETRTAIADSRYIRTAALANRVTYYTTMAGCEAATEALKHQTGMTVLSLQELHAELH